MVVALGFACEKFVFKLLQAFFSLATQLFYNSPRIWSPLLTSEQSSVTDAALQFHVTEVLPSFFVHVVIIIMLNHLEEIQERGMLYCMFSLGFLLFSVYSPRHDRDFLPFGEVLPPFPILLPSVGIRYNDEDD